MSAAGRWGEFCLVLAFFSRLPVPAHPPARLSEALWALPLASGVIALPAAAVLGAAWALGAAPLIAALAAVAALVVATGALHEDGLADCADGFWGGAEAERRLEIMRDSRIGAYGVLALIFAVLCKVALLHTALAHGPHIAAALLASSAIIARSFGLLPAVALPPARSDGLAVLAGRPTWRAYGGAVILALALAAALALWISPAGLVLAVIAAAAVSRGVVRLADAKIGGVTGDVLGAAIVLADLAYLAAFTMWLSSTVE